ncbi:thymidine phosphorylase [uncultured Veillonella sp.]|uniref:thymidine phosphorylase n=1 Tax=uncultured Veillonella sp. TaxID=159268 RepID=UPI0025DB64BC|nr:thymidine phosphorylase [uncultured Veillonella sp.]
MRMYDVILKKRQGIELSDKEIQWLIRGYVEGNIPDYQMSAFLMAVMFKGMTTKELGTFTMAMAHSGDMVNLSAIKGIKVDKHSTGGVGDKTTLVIASLVAACGGVVAKMSGRGLGHTGGTIDKMESIPGLKTELSEEAFRNQVNNIGVAVIGQSSNIAPADKKIYALRDVTATVDSIPLIASSIMSKKLASGADAILLDVKVGSGAFMKSLDEAHTLAQTMVDIGRENKRIVKAVITDMDRPLGYAIGNALEIAEVIQTLRGHGPRDLTDECLVMAAYLLVMSEKGDYDTCYAKVQSALQNGDGLAKLRELIISQGGDGRVVDNISLLGQSQFTYDIKTSSAGYITHMDTEACGIASVMLGAGRTVKDGPIDMTAGIVMHKKTGDSIAEGDVIATLYADDESLFEGAAHAYIQALTIGLEKPVSRDTILAIVE